MTASTGSSLPDGRLPLRVLSGGAPQSVLQALRPSIVAAVGRPIDLTFAIVGTIMQRLAAGDRADLVMLPLQLIDKLGEAVALRADSRCLIARVGIGAIVRAGAARPDISSAAAVRAMLLAAGRIALPDPATPSGSHLTKAIADLGIAVEVAGKSIHKGAIHGGGELVAAGAADIGLYLVSEVRAVPGVEVVGLLPAPVQSYVVYGAAIPAASVAPGDAAKFLRCITDPANAEAWTAGGFEMLQV